MPPIDVPRTASFFIVMNAASGDSDASEVRAQVEDAMARAGRKVFFRLVEEPGHLPEVARQAVQQAVEHEGVIVAAGGDGTIAAVAQEALGKSCPFGVLPQGTFNYFSRVHRIPADPVQAAQLLMTARAHPVQVGLLNDKVFLVNASLGLYPRLLEDREAYKQALGRHRIVAVGAALSTLLHRHRHLRLSMQHAGRQHTLTTSTLFVGNNEMQIEQLGIPMPRRLARGELAAIMVKPVSNARLLWLALQGALGRLDRADDVVSFPLRDMTVRPLLPFGGRVKVAYDGETGLEMPPIRIRVADQPLYLLKSEPAVE